MERDELIRLLAETHAVLEDDQYQQMAKSMDLEPYEVRAMFAVVETEWEAIKDRIVEGQG